jgi:hypothetical protein
MVKIVKTWAMPTTLTPEFVGKMASCHGTHDCLMCHFEKHYSKPRKKNEWIEEDNAMPY